MKSGEAKRGAVEVGAGEEIGAGLDPAHQRNCQASRAGNQRENELLEAGKFIEEIMSTLATWRFTPATFDGRTCEVEFVPRFTFTLQRRR